MDQIVEIMNTPINVGDGLTLILVVLIVVVFGFIGSLIGHWLFWK